MSDVAHLTPSCSLDAACEEQWDALVIGAGLSGSMAARELALRGLSVLLVDKANFPRRKVCGCYLNGSALSSLSKSGLGSLVSRLQAPQVNRVRFGTQRKTAELRLPAGAALSRESLDTALIQEAIAAGSAFLPKVDAKLGEGCTDHRNVDLQVGLAKVTARCKVAIVADGINGHSLRGNTEVQFRTACASLIGASTATEDRPAQFEVGKIYMAIGAAGYVGALKIEDGRLDIAGAFDPLQVKKMGLPTLASSIIEQSGLPEIKGLHQLRWLGTAPLTRTPSSQAGHRFFLVGDAAGYVEPFTGEGMSWALASARAVVPFALEAVQSYSPDLMQRWTKRHRSVLKNRQKACRLLTSGLRSPVISSMAVTLLSRFPAIASPFLRWMNHAPVG